jgi:hypothetical protein
MLWVAGCGLRGAGHSRQAKDLGGLYMREISIYKLQIPNKLQKANYKSQTKAKNQKPISQQTCLGFTFSFVLNPLAQT